MFKITSKEKQFILRNRINAANKGSYLDNKLLPKEGAIVFVLVGSMSPFKVMKGKVSTLSNIDNKGLNNTYMDILLDNGKINHVHISMVFDHKPKQEKVTDEYGETTVWR
jgi:hypothetical protein